MPQHRQGPDTVRTAVPPGLGEPLPVADARVRAPLVPGTAGGGEGAISDGGFLHPAEAELDTTEEQARALILTVTSPFAWLGWLALFYLAGSIAYENMYRRSAAEARNEFVIERNRFYRRFNPGACVVMALVMGVLLGFHLLTGTAPSWPTLLLVTAFNVAFLLRGEGNWRVIVGAARRTST